MGRLLGQRDLRYWLLGQAISLTGTWITRVAIGYLVWRLTRSAAALGIVAFAGQIPSLLLSPLAGALADRWDRRRVLIATQALSAAQSAALATLAFTGVAGVPALVALAAIQGVVNALDMPARQSLLVRLVERRDDLAGAIALNASVVHATRFVGPVIAGVLIALVGEGWCFALDAVSYLAAILALTRLPGGSAPPARRPAGLTAEVLEGLRWVRGFPPARDVLLLLASISVLGMPHAVLLPALAADPASLGFLTGASGAGALAGAVWLARRGTVVGLDRLVHGAALAFGGGLLVLAISPWFWLSLAALVLVGAGMMVVMAATNTMLQTVVDEDKRGRVMSFHTMAFFGAAPFGAWAAGLLADRLGAPAVIGAGGALCVASAAWFERRLALRESVALVPARPGIGD